MAMLRSIRVQMVATSWKRNQGVRVVGDRMGSPGDPWGCQGPTYGGVWGSDAHTIHKLSGSGAEGGHPPPRSIVSSIAGDPGIGK